MLRKYIVGLCFAALFFRKYMLEDNKEKGKAKEPVV